MPGAGMQASARHNCRNSATITQVSDVLVGRVVECSLISALLDRAADQRPSVVLVVGEAGVGKTTLLREALRRAEERGFAVATGAAVPGASGLAFAPVRSALRAITDMYGRDRVEELVRRHPGVETLLPAPPPAHGGGHPEAGELYVRLLDLIVELTEERPLLLALEDLHWADRSTLELLSFLVRNVSGERLAVMITVRTDDADLDAYAARSMAECSRLQVVERIDLAPFGPAEVRALATSVLGEAPDDALLDDVLRRSEGNPFFAVELLTADARGGLPPSVREVVDMRLGLVGDRHRQVLRAAAVVGATVDPELVAAYLERPADEIDEALRAAIDAEILVVDPDAGALRFRHALLHEHAYGQLLAGERRRLHDRLADILALDPETPAALLAFHLERAHRHDDALLATLTAARAADADGAVDAVHHYRRAVELWSACDEPAEALGCRLVDVLEEGVASAMNVGIDEIGQELVELLLEELDPETDPERWVLHAAALNEIYWETGRGTDADALLARARTLIPEGTASPAAVRLHERSSYTALLVGDVPTADAQAHAAMAAAEALGDPALEAIALGRLGLVHVTDGDSAALDELRRATDLARALGPGHEAARATINHLLILHASGDLHAASAAVTEVQAHLDEIAVGPLDRSMLEILFARTHIACGRLADAADTLAASVTPSAIRYREYRAIADAELAIATGDLEWAREALLEFEPSDAMLVAVHRATVEAELALRAGRPADAQQRIDEYLPIAVLLPEVSLLRLCALGIQAAAAGDDAIDHYRSLAESKHAALSGHSVICPAHLDGLLWDVENLHAGATGAAPIDGRRAAAAFDEAGQVLRAAWARLHHAQALIEAGGDRSSCTTDLALAHGWAVDAGAGPLRRAIEDLVRRARLDVPGVERLARHDLGLTGREAEVLRLVAEGRTNREIADALIISPKTASVHVSNILRKVGAANRGEAAAVAHRHGLDLVH